MWWPCPALLRVSELIHPSDTEKGRIRRLLSVTHLFVTFNHLESSDVI